MTILDTLYYHLLIERDRLYRLNNRGKSSEFILGKISIIEEILSQMKKEVDEGIKREEEILNNEMNLKALRKYKRIFKKFHH